MSTARVSTDNDVVNTVNTVHDANVLTKSRQLFIHSLPETSELDSQAGVDYLMAAQLIKNLMFLKEQSETDPVLIHMQTPGGSYSDGMAMYDVISSMPFHVTILTYAHARSMSSIILQAADRRIMMPHSYFMIHFGETTMIGEHKAVVSHLQFIEKVDTSSMLDIYTDKAVEGAHFQGVRRSRVKSRIKEAMEKKGDFFMTPEEAIDWGFADEIFDGDWSGLKDDLETVARKKKSASRRRSRR